MAVLWAVFNTEASGFLCTTLTHMNTTARRHAHTHTCTPTRPHTYRGGVCPPTHARPLQALVCGLKSVFLHKAGHVEDSVAWAGNMRAVMASATKAAHCFLLVIVVSNINEILVRVCVTVSPFAPLATVLAVQVVSPDRFLHLPASFNRHLRLFPSLISIDFTSAFESPSESCISTVFCVTTLLPFELWGFRLVMDPCRHVYNCHAPFRTCILITANPSFFKKFQRGNV